MKLVPCPAFCRSVLIGVLACFIVCAADPVRTVVLVRHAERAGGTDPDVGISDAGRCRAGVLAAMLADANVGTIYTSEVARTRQTAEPLAQKLEIRPEAIPAKDIDALAAKIRAGAPERTILVVGHSNTIPKIVELLSGEAVPPIADSEYDRMYIVTLAGAKEAKVLKLRYSGCAR